MIPRRLQARKIRQEATELASLREHPVHVNNGEELKYRNQDNQPTHIANFTKGLPHDTKTGLLLNPVDYQQFVLGIQSGDPKDFAQTPLGPAKLPSTPGGLSIEETTIKWTSQIAQDADVSLRAWESAGAGLVFELEGFDAQALTMPPAPTLDSVELAAEVAEVYLQALLRDIHFSQLREPSLDDNQQNPPVSCPQPEKTIGQVQEFFSADSATKIEKAIEILNQVQIGDRNWFNSNELKLTEAEKRRKRPAVTLQNLFRGITPGDQVGPYLSQFLLIGNPKLDTKGQSQVSEAQNGLIAYGSVRIDQRVRTAEPCKDYMTTFEAWLDVQNGADVRRLETYEDGTGANAPYRFLTTPRDLATYVHYDALYEAYLNACLLLLGMGAPFDPGIPFQRPDVEDKQQGFAHFGGPQILTLVCEVATRALKAVRYQKFNIHRRLRPEAVGGLIDRYKQAALSSKEKEAFKPIKKLVDALDEVGLLDLVAAHNQQQNQTYSDRQKDPSQDSNLYLPIGKRILPKTQTYICYRWLFLKVLPCTPHRCRFLTFGWRPDLGGMKDSRQGR